jgi:hypothetical protein
MDDINVEWLDKKSPINHLFKGFHYYQSGVQFTNLNRYRTLEMK